MRIALNLLIVLLEFLFGVLIEIRRLDEAVSAKLAELEIVMNDLERTNERVALLEREKDLLRAKLDAPHGSKELEEKCSSFFLFLLFSLSLSLSLLLNVPVRLL